jgi:hypothetical protein
MDINKFWEKALNNTDIVRSRIKALQTFGDTHVPYILLSESQVDHNDTVVRKGEVVVKKPGLILPPNVPQFEGFDFNEEKVFEQDALVNFLIVRGVHMPSMKYDNKTFSLDIYEGKLKESARHYQDLLQKREDTQTGLLLGPQDCWQFSVLIFICTQIARDTRTDIEKLLKEYRKRNP